MSLAWRVLGRRVAWSSFTFAPQLSAQVLEAARAASVKLGDVVMDAPAPKAAAKVLIAAQGVLEQAKAMSLNVKGFF